MKKLFLSAAVIVSFIAYSLTLRHDGSRSVSAPPTASSTNPTSAPSSSETYKNGEYTGDVTDAFYGNIQVRATITGGKITAVEFLQYPNDRRTSIEINQQAMPLLQQEAVQAQSAHVNGVSGATDTSQAFMQSLSSALAQAV